MAIGDSTNNESAEDDQFEGEIDSIDDQQSLEYLASKKQKRLKNPSVKPYSNGDFKHSRELETPLDQSLDSPNRNLHED